MRREPSKPINWENLKPYLASLQPNGSGGADSGNSQPEKLPQAPAIPPMAEVPVTEKVPQEPVAAEQRTAAQPAVELPVEPPPAPEEPQAESPAPTTVTQVVEELVQNIPFPHPSFIRIQDKYQKGTLTLEPAQRETAAAFEQILHDEIYKYDDTRETFDAKQASGEIMTNVHEVISSALQGEITPENLESKLTQKIYEYATNHGLDQVGLRILVLEVLHMEMVLDPSFPESLNSTHPVAPIVTPAPAASGQEAPDTSGSAPVVTHASVSTPLIVGTSDQDNRDFASGVRAIPGIQRALTPTVQPAVTVTQQSSPVKPNWWSRLFQRKPKDATTNPTMQAVSWKGEDPDRTLEGTLQQRYNPADTNPAGSFSTALPTTRPYFHDPSQNGNAIHSPSFQQPIPRPMSEVNAPITPPGVWPTEPEGMGLPDAEKGTDGRWVVTPAVSDAHIKP